MGAVGLDIHLADLVQEFTYFNSPGGRSYVFLIDSIGKRNIDFINSELFSFITCL